MSTKHTPAWLKNVLLLGALAAGTCTAQLMPAYQDHMGKITYPSAAAARSDEQPEEEGYSSIESQQPVLALVSNSTQR